MQSCYEFRCFVSEGQLVGISQRDCANFYEFLLDQKQQVHSAPTAESYTPTARSVGGAGAPPRPANAAGRHGGAAAWQILDALQAFHAEEIRGRFPEKSYAFDAYIRYRDYKAKCQYPSPSPPALSPRSLDTHRNTVGTRRAERTRRSWAGVPGGHEPAGRIDAAAALRVARAVRTGRGPGRAGAPARRVRHCHPPCHVHVRSHSARPRNPFSVSAVLGGCERAAQRRSMARVRVVERTGEHSDPCLTCKWVSQPRS